MQTPAEKYGLDKPCTDWGRDGNAMFIAGAVRRALKDEGYPPEALAEFSEDVLSGDYDHVLQTAMKWCDLDSPEDEYDEDDDEVECAQCGRPDDPEEMKTINGEFYCWSCRAEVEDD